MSLYCASDHFLHPPERCPSSAESYHCRYRPSGLINTDNRCYLNAAVHFLFASETFRSYLRHLHVHGAATHETPLHAELISALPYFTAADDADGDDSAVAKSAVLTPPPHVESALPMSSAAARRRRRRRQKAEDAATTTTAAVTRANVSPSVCSRSPVHIPFTSALTAARLRVGLQHDAHEFIVRLFERLSDEAATVAQTRSDEKRRDDDADAEWTEIGKRSKKLIITNTAAASSSAASPLTELFAVRERSTVDVTSRAHSSVNVSAHFTLLLTLNANDNAAQNTLTKLIAAHFTAQRLDNYKGNRQRQNFVRAIITNAVDLAKMPRTLIVTFKRFAFDAADGAVRKIGARVSFDATLRLHSDSAVVFTLVSVIVHHGDSAANGHYTTFARVFDDKRADKKSATADEQLWIEIDDTHVTAVPAAAVYASLAYCLLYSQFPR